MDTKNQLENFFSKEVMNELTTEFLTDFRDMYLKEMGYNRDSLVLGVQYSTAGFNKALVSTIKKFKATNLLSFYKNNKDSDEFGDELQTVMVNKGIIPNSNKKERLAYIESNKLKSKLVPLTDKEKMEEIIRQQDIKHHCTPEDNVAIRKRIEEKKKQVTTLPPEIEAMITDNFLRTFKEEYLKFFENRTLKYGLDWQTTEFWEAFTEACRIDGKSGLLTYHLTNGGVTSQIERLMIKRGIIPAYKINKETGLPVEIEKHLTSEFLSTFLDEFYIVATKRFGKDVLAKKIKDRTVAINGYGGAFDRACKKHNSLELLNYFMYEIDDVCWFGATLEKIMKSKGIVKKREQAKKGATMDDKDESEMAMLNVRLANGECVCMTADKYKKYLADNPKFAAKDKKEYRTGKSPKEMMADTLARKETMIMRWTNMTAKEMMEYLENCAFAKELEEAGEKTAARLKNMTLQEQIAFEAEQIQKMANKTGRAISVSNSQGFKKIVLPIEE